MTSTAADTGSLRRGVRLLRLLATAGARGSSLTDLASETGMPHPSVHRVLKQLQAERLVEHNPDTRRYRLGPLTFELGLASSTLFDIRDLCEPAMRRLAECTADTVYLVCRSGFDAVCIHRLEGAFPIRTLVLEVGSRRPLGVGAGGLAVLAAIGAPVAHLRRVGCGRPAPSMRTHTRSRLQHGGRHGGRHGQPGCQRRRHGLSQQHGPRRGRAERGRHVAAHGRAAVE
jgi:DNA-binding IclR family transcriptional regulator